MAVNIKNTEVERLLDEIVATTGETKTEAVRRALEERRSRLALRGLRGGRAARFLAYLESEFWPSLPEGERGRRLTKEEEEDLLGLGPGGA